MGTKKQPSKYDCYSKAEPDEPMFILLGRDKDAPALVKLWARRRKAAGENLAIVEEARACAIAMESFRLKRIAHKLTPAQRKVVLNLHAGRPASHGLSGQSAFGGLTATVASLWIRSLITKEHRLTSDGDRVAMHLLLGKGRK